MSSLKVRDSALKAISNQTLSNGLDSVAPNKKWNWPLGEERYTIAKANFKRLITPPTVPFPGITTTRSASIPLPKLQFPQCQRVPPISKLAYETCKQWELSQVDDFPAYSMLHDLLETRARSLEMVPIAFKNTKPTVKNVLHAMHNQSNLERAKLAAIKEEGACINYLSKGHVFVKCRSLSSSHICQCHHHTLLHSSLNSQPTEPANISLHYADFERVILLAIAEVLLKDYANR
ncbi:unnamed protein product [Ceratitis capitata]|uniref:(Mediterranean fruit fly) hypothetical protein n=1 Tax=Ceratitis capitata TaxID=7213 RepID=A0A811URT8_CERCA|nr:unnamed protein product [Ceratitis capitata]